MAVQKLPSVSILLLAFSVLPHTAQGLTQTTLTLAASPNPSTYGAPVTLTATVAPSNATGRVTFYDGVTILGTSPLSGGSASLLTSLLPFGPRKLQAFYTGDSLNAAATSNVVTQTVNAQASTGFVSRVATTLLTSAIPGDFNGDGVADLAVSFLDSSLGVMLGNGAGTLQSIAINPPLFGAPLAVADFNGDGKADLLVKTDAGILELLGNGDGTFQSSVKILSTFRSAVVGDFNGDGKPDLAIGDPNGVNILLGKGDGTFQPGVVYPLGIPSEGINILAVGDFNGDGKADLVASLVPTVSILLGNGDGTFQLPINDSAQTLPNFILVADLNKDGKADLVTVSSPNKVSIQLGNGDGTLQPPIATYVAQSAIVAAVADFNGDGNADIAIFGAISAPTANNVSVLLGNGDGVFQLPINYTAAFPPFLIAGDFNGDGKTDLLTGGALLLGANLSLTATGGTSQSTVINTPFPNLLQAKLMDSLGNPVSGAIVTFDAPSIGASAILPPPPAVTNASGVVTIPATANNIVGSYFVTASVGLQSVSFSLTNTARPPASITATGGTPQSATVGNAFPNALQAIVKDSLGNPVSGVSVTFVAPASGTFGISPIPNGPSAILSTTTVLTNASGIAAVTAMANSTPGTYFVTASVGVLSASFSLTNLFAGTPSQISNVALGKAATQSSTLSGYPTTGPGSAVDNNTDGNFFNGSVTHTNLDTNAWWQVDLGASAAVNSIMIWSRTDCCVNRLSDYWIFVSDTPFAPTDTPATLQNRAGTFSSHQTTAPNPLATVAVGAQGRYVRVQLTGADYLSLAEIQVLGTGGGPGAPASPNLAQGKAASQSSTLSGYPTTGPGGAVDGNTDGNFFDGSVTHTNLQVNPWWQVDLGTSSAVNSITIWNRTDACCVSRLSDYWVFVSNTPFAPTDTPATLQNRAGTFASHQTTAPSPSITIAVGAQGRYVRIQLTGANYLSLAEVQVQ